MFANHNKEMGILFGSFKTALRFEKGFVSSSVEQSEVPPVLVGSCRRESGIVMPVAL